MIRTLRTLRTLRTTVFLLVLGACSSVPPLANTYGSSDELAVAVLDALARKDRARLDAIAVGEQEFRDYVWPALPAARPERNLPFSYVWGDLHQKSDISLARTLARHGGTRYTLKRVSFSGKTDYEGYTVHRDARFEATDADGSSTELRVCGSFLHTNGVWKVFSYVVDE